MKGFYHNSKQVPNSSESSFTDSDLNQLEGNDRKYKDVYAIKTNDSFSVDQTSEEGEDADQESSLLDGEIIQDTMQALDFKSGFDFQVYTHMIDAQDIPGLIKFVEESCANQPKYNS